MQILSVSADHYARNHNYLNQMHRLRAAVFGTRLEWDVTGVGARIAEMTDFRL